MVKINTKEYNPETGEWNIDCVVETYSGTRSGICTVQGSADDTEDALSAKVLALY